MLCAYQHGRKWRSKVNASGIAGAVLIARGLADLHAWVDAHRKKD